MDKLLVTKSQLKWYHDLLTPRERFTDLKGNLLFKCHSLSTKEGIDFRKCGNDLKVWREKYNVV